ncbi:MAG: AIPR family protein [Bacteroidetes bacterium]|nr:AIPR family protein [Bacteroidota bacterium]
MAKAKKPIIEKNLSKFINDNFDKKDRRKSDSVKFEWFVNSMHIWQSSSQFYNSNTKIGKDISLGTSQGGDAFYVSVNNFEQIFFLYDNIEEVIDYLKKHGKSITFHFIQTKKSENANWPDFLNLIDVPLKIWKGQEFSKSQPILINLQEFIDKITDDDDSVLGKIEHKIEISFYTNKDNDNIVKLEDNWKTDIENKKNELANYFPLKNIEILFRGSGFLNEIFEKINSNDYSLLVNKEEVIEAEEKKYLIGYITAKELLDSIAPVVNGKRTLYPDVFKNNIRLYLGRNKVNEKIEETLMKDSKRFHFYNNGITITTKEINDNSKNFIICPVNIVNGCQTANSIYNVSKSEDFNEKDVKIPVKIIVAQDKEYENITIRTNTQNGLETKDLISITNTQIELQEEFEKVKFLGKSFHYKRQKSADENANLEIDYIVQIDDILRATLSTLMLIPNKVSGYFDQTTLKYVDKIFDERFAKLYLIMTSLLKLVEDEVDEKYPEFSRLKYHLIYLIYKLSNKEIDIKSFEEYFREGTEDIEEEEIIKQNQLINKVYSNIYLVLKNKTSFDKVLVYVTTKIKENYSGLLDLSDKEKEKILYKPVEKLKRTRATPVFENFSSVFTDDYKTIISDNVPL